MINLASVSDQILNDMHRAVFELCVITSDAAVANRRAAADNYPSPLAGQLDAAYPALKADMDAAYRMWDAIVAETETRQHRIQVPVSEDARSDEAIRKLGEQAAAAVAAGDAHGDVTWTVNGTQC